MPNLFQKKKTRLRLTAYEMEGVISSFARQFTQTKLSIENDVAQAEIDRFLVGVGRAPIRYLITPPVMDNIITQYKDTPNVSTFIEEVMFRVIAIGVPDADDDLFLQRLCRNLADALNPIGLIDDHFDLISADSSNLALLELWSRPYGEPVSIYPNWSTRFKRYLDSFRVQPTFESLVTRMLYSNRAFIFMCAYILSKSHIEEYLKELANVELSKQ